MHQVTVREIMSLSALAGTYVIAGAEGLNRTVTGVNVMEVPDIEDYVKEGEILLTTAYPVRERPQRLVELVPVLAGRGLAALAIKPMRYLDGVPDDLVEVADRMRFPVLVVPDDTSFNEVIGAVLAVVLADYGADPARAEAIRERLTGVVLSGGGLKEMARTLAGALNRPVTVIDEAGVVQGSAREVLAPPDPSQPGPADVWGYPVTVAGRPRGQVLVGGADEPTLGQRRLIRQSCFAAGMHIAQLLAGLELDRRLQLVFLEELVTGSRMDDDALAQRARLHGWDLEGPHEVLVAECSVGLTELQVDRAARRVLGERARAWCRGNRVLAIRHVPFSEDLSAGGRWHDELVRLGGGQVAVASGAAAVTPKALARSHRTAQEALQLAQRTGRDHVRHADLALERLLLAAPEHQLQDFVERHLGVLLDHDAQNRTDLCATLEAFLGLGNSAEAARRLYVHYNTMKHRLQRITELTAADLSDPRTRLTLAVALEVAKVLGPQHRPDGPEGTTGRLP